jgi:hypothetical protein
MREEEDVLNKGIFSVWRVKYLDWFETSISW